MAEQLYISPELSKREQYEQVLTQLASLVDGETNLVANLANIAAVMQVVMQNLWTGFYLVDQAENNLVLGPFQGPLACTRIAYGKGVCGTAWKENKTIVVPNVHEFPGHIACSDLSNSELVVPFKNQSGQVAGVIDLDSATLNFYGEDEIWFTESVAKLIGKIC